MHSLYNFCQITKNHVKYYWGDFELLFFNSDAQIYFNFNNYFFNFQNKKEVLVRSDQEPRIGLKAQRSGRYHLLVISYISIHNAVFDIK